MKYYQDLRSDEERGIPGLRDLYSLTEDTYQEKFGSRYTSEALQRVSEHITLRANGDANEYGLRPTDRLLAHLLGNNFLPTEMSLIRIQEERESASDIRFSRVCGMERREFRRFEFIYALELSLNGGAEERGDATYERLKELQEQAQDTMWDNPVAFLRLRREVADTIKETYPGYSDYDYSWVCEW